MKRTSYILQFLWRAVTSCFNIFGPYFSIEEAMNVNIVGACVLEAIQLFHVSDA